MAAASAIVTPGLVDIASPSAEPFRMLRLALDLRSAGDAGHTVVVTSPHQGDGKSTVAANYALVSALTRGRVLLVDADLRNPRLHSLFGLPRSPGVAEVIRDNLSLEDGIRSSGYFRLDVLTSGAAITRAGDLAASRQLHALLAAARSAYDLVVIDTPPVLLAADAAGIAASSDVDCLLVIRPTAKRRQVSQAVRKLQLMDANLVGLVVNRDGRVATYGY